MNGVKMLTLDAGIENRIHRFLDDGKRASDAANIDCGQHPPSSLMCSAKTHRNHAFAIPTVLIATKSDEKAGLSCMTIGDEYPRE